MLNNPKLNKKPIKIRRALISVFDKTNIVSLAQSLVEMNIKILSTGGTFLALENDNIPVTDISNYTKFPEIMDGRVKTINPLIGGGILGLRDEHFEEAKTNNIKWIDLVICNLYPFSKAISQEGCDLAFALENIDIGGPTMVRAAAKNIGWACVCIDPKDYSIITEELSSSCELTFNTRKKLAVKAFGHTAQYDAIVHGYLKEELFPNSFSPTYYKHSELRYGENPHQKSAAYQNTLNESNNVLSAKMHQGKKLSYNNIMDADAALACLKELNDIACVVVKHANPCGVSLGKNTLEAYSQAFDADSLSAFGGVVALNRECTQEVATSISEVFIEIIMAPSFDDESLIIFSKKKNLRVLEIGQITKKEKKTELRYVDGGLLVQDTDCQTLTTKDLKIVTETHPTSSELETMVFGWKVLKHVKSNGILIVKEGRTIGVGAGQVSRVDSVDLAIKKAGNLLEGTTLCSDAFFPFRDSIDKISKTGILSIIQPGGSVRDQEIIDACNEYGISMVFTGQRCFKH